MPDTKSASDNRAPQQVVIVGAGLGGVQSAENLRRRGFKGRITLLGAESHHPYDRPPLSKQVLREDRPPPLLRTLEQLDPLDIELRLQTPAMGMSVESKIITTPSESVEYDVAVIATGANPRRLPGIDGKALRTLEDAYELRSQLRAGTRLVIIGAGLIGCEVAASANALGAHVAVVDVLRAPAVRVLGQEVGEVLAGIHAEHGIELHLGVGVVKSHAGLVSLSDGKELEADIVLEAVGAQPAVEWLMGSGLGLDDGIVCDADGRAAPGVYAVGDVANWAGRRHEHWTNVGHQADHVAAAILDQPSPPPEVPYWWSDQYDLRLQGLGHPGPDDDVKILKWSPRSRTVAVYSLYGRLTGLVGFSAAGAIMRLRPDVAAGSDVDDVIARLTP